MTTEAKQLQGDIGIYLRTDRESRERLELRRKRELYLGKLSQEVRTFLLSGLDSNPGFTDALETAGGNRLLHRSGYKELSFSDITRTTNVGETRQTKLTIRTYGSTDERDLVMEEGLQITTVDCISPDGTRQATNGGIHFNSESVDPLSRREEYNNDEDAFEKIKRMIQGIIELPTNFIS